MSTRFTGKKRPTPREEPTKPPVTDILREHRKGLVAAGAILLLLVIGIVLFFTFRGREADKNWAAMHSALEVSSPESQFKDRMRLYQELMPSERFSTQITNPLPSLKDLREVAGSDLKAHVLLQIASKNAEKGDYAKALEVIDELESEFQDHPVNALPSPDSRYSLVGQLKLWCKSEIAWKEAHAVEPVEVDTTTTALFETNKGSFWVGFYPEHSPEHVAHFMARAKAGGFNGISVISLGRAYLRLGGEASKDDDPKNDGDEEPTSIDPLQPEKGRYAIPQDLGSLSSATIRGGESPVLLDLTLEDRPLRMDKTQTVFGKVLMDRAPGMSALDLIKNLKTYQTSEDERYKNNPEYSDIQDHPVETVRVTRVSIWTGGKLADGHTWDTSAVVEPGTEPVPPPEEPESPKDEEDKGAEEDK